MTERYEIVQASAGEGGYGRIDKAEDTALERPVAIKTLDPLFKSTPSPDDIERFHREAKALAQLSHPNIPAIYDIEFSPEDSTFQIIFEWIDGPTLRDYLNDRGVLSLEEARLHFGEICSALTHAHDRGIVHRDIKPTNVILSDYGATSTLVDFGIALRQDDVTRLTTDTPIGTPGYMSPEQERGDDLAAASDIFALGVLLYECLSGARPAVGGYKPLSIHNEAIPPGIDALIQAALDEDPARRPATPKEFAERLNTTLKPHSSFTATLADGSLHEIQLALNAMDPRDYEALPPGQRRLLLTRMTDLRSVDDERLRRAVATFVTELVNLAYTGDTGEYGRIVEAAVDYGYFKQYGENWKGNQPTRAALNDVALSCQGASHQLLTEAALGLCGTTDLADQQGWYTHDLRVLLQQLLTNPSCDDNAADKLGDALDRLNETTH